MDERVDPRRAARAEHRDRLARQLLLAQQARAQRVVDVVVDVGDAVDHPHDPPLERLRQRRAAGVARDPVAHLLGEVRARPRRARARRRSAASARSGGSPLAEALLQAAVEHLLADVPERRMAEVVAEADRLGEVLVERQRPRDGARDRGHLERVREPRAVVVARAARRTPASCGSGAERPCCARSGRGRAETACAARSPPLRAPAAPGRSARPAARAAAPPALAPARREAPPRRRPARRRRSPLGLCHRRGAGRLRARASSRCAPVSRCTQWCQRFCSRGILVVHRRPAARRRQAVARRRRRCAGRRRARGATRPSAASTKRRPCPAWRSQARGRCPARAPPPRGATVPDLLAVGARARARPCRAPGRRSAVPRPWRPRYRPAARRAVPASRRRASAAGARGARASPRSRARPAPSAGSARLRRLAQRARERLGHEPVGVLARAGTSRPRRPRTRRRRRPRRSPTRCSASPQLAHAASCGARPAASSSFRRNASARRARRSRAAPARRPARRAAPAGGRAG